MINPQQPLNSWLVSYIMEQHQKRSRYEIDKYLLELGHNPAEIEQAWQQVTAISKRFERKVSGWGLTGGIVACFLGIPYILSRIDMLGTGVDKGYADKTTAIGIALIIIGICAIIGATLESRLTLKVSGYFQLGAGVAALFLFFIMAFTLSHIDLGFFTICMVIGLLITGGVRTLKNPD